MSLKHNIVFIILGFFLFKIGIIDMARNAHLRQSTSNPTNNTDANFKYDRRGIR